MTKKKINIENKNLIFSLANVVVSALQSLWLISYIQNIMGIEAYGYMSVILGILNMTTILSVALTSVSSRFITLELKKGNVKKANAYFNSIFFGLTFICIIILLLVFAFIIHIEFFINVEGPYIYQVKILTLFISAGLLLTIIDTPFMASLYYTNQTYKMHGLMILVYISRMLFAFTLYDLYYPQLWYAYLGDFIAQLVVFLYYLLSYKKTMPGIILNYYFFSKKVLKEVLDSGIWVSISKVGVVLLSSVSIYLSNLLFSPYISGVYSSVLQMSSLLALLTNALVTTFIPSLYQIYAKNDTVGLVEYVLKKIYLLGATLGLISGGIWVFGKYFMSIWINNSYLEYELLIRLTVVYIPIAYSCEILNQVLITYNKTKVTAGVMIFSGIVNIFLSLVFAKIFNLGIYSLPFALMISDLGRAFFYYPYYCSWITGSNKTLFLKQLCKGMCVSFITILIGYILKYLIYPDSFGKLILDAFIVSTIVGIIFFRKLKKNL